MTDKPAAFRATFVDVRPVRSRGQVRFVFEVPAEMANQALACLGGIPNEKTAVWCAVARLKPEDEKSHPLPDNSTAPEPDAERAKRIQEWADLKPSVQSGILRNTEAFWRYLEQECGASPILSSEGAAAVIRALCGVKSCSDLTSDNQNWVKLYRGYRRWIYEPEIVG